MSNEEDKNYVSVGSWMFMLLIISIPVVGQIMILVWAFAGHNESRKNYFRAILAWILALIALLVILILVGSGPAILKHIQSLTHRA